MYLEKRKVIIKICLIMVLIFEFVRALEDHKNFNLRKFGRRKAKSSISVRAEDSSSEVEENKENEKEDKESDVDTAQSSDSDDRALRSTRGINPDEFEPEPNSRYHNRGKSSDTESEAR